MLGAKVRVGMSQVSKDTTNDEIDLGELLSKLLLRRWSIFFITAVVSLVGLIFAFLSTPIYQADALIQLEEKSGSSLAISSELTGLLSEETQSVTEIEILKSRMVLGEVVENLRLNQIAAPRTLPMIGNFLTRYNLPDPGWSFFEPYAWNKESIELGLIEVPDRYVGEPFIVTSTGDGTYSLTVAGEKISGVVGSMVENAAGDFKLLITALTGQTGREFSVIKIDAASAIQNLRNNLNVVERGKSSSILQVTFTDPNPVYAQMVLKAITEIYQSQNLTRNAAEAEKSLDFIQEQLPQAQAKVQEAETALNAFKLSQESVDLSFETRAVLEQVVALEAQLNQLSLEEQELQKRYTQSHPSYQTLLDNRAQLERQLAEIRSQTSSLPQTQQEMLRLSQDLEVAQQVYLQLLNRGQELNVIRAGTIGNIRIIDDALASFRPVKPNKKLILAMAMVAGLVLAVVFSLLRDFLTRGIQSAEELEELSIPVYATIPKIANGWADSTGKKREFKITAKTDPTSVTVEALRSLRTSLHFGMLDAKTSLMMVTSARPTEGKSFMSVNLATVMAQAGQNVCLVDTDTRRGYLHKFYGAKKSGPGLTDVLAGTADIEDVIHQDPDSGLYYITCGKYPPNPSELLMGNRFQEVLKYLDERFDLTILDTPPILAVTDPIIVGKYVSMIMLVTRYDVTQLNEIRACQQRLETNGLKISGAVLNAFDPRKANQKYAMSYQYDYQTRKN